MATLINNYEPVSKVPVDYTKEITIITRAQWNAMPPKVIEKIAHPIEKFHFKFENIEPPCSTKEECLKTVKRIQNFWYDRGMEDLPYNFLVGEDGNVYEGRGWFYKPGPEVSFRREYQQTLQIGIIGGHDVATDENMKSMRNSWLLAKRVCNLGVQLKYAKEDYEIVGFKDDLLDFNVNYHP